MKMDINPDIKPFERAGLGRKYSAPISPIENNH